VLIGKQARATAIGPGKAAMPAPLTMEDSEMKIAVFAGDGIGPEVTQEAGRYSKR
jgi:hypothetical protein